MKIEKIDISSDVDELIFFAKESWKLTRVGFGLIVMGIEALVILVSDISTVLFVIVHGFIFVFSKILMGLLSVWDKENYDKIQKEKWKD